MIPRLFGPVGYTEKANVVWARRFIFLTSVAETGVPDVLKSGTP